MATPSPSFDVPAAQTRVLLVEDDPLVVRAVTRALRSHAVEVTHATSMADICRLGEHQDVGIFDIDLPETNGIEIAALCVLHRRVGQVVFFSATHNEIQLRAARTLGELISKGDGVELLIGHVLSACGRPSGVYGKPPAV